MLYLTFNQAIWKNDFPRYMVRNMEGKKVKHVLEIIAGLSILGPSTTRELARFVLLNDHSYPRRPILEKDARVLEQIYYKLIEGRLRYESGKKKSQKKYPGLVDHEFLLPVGKKLNSQNREVPTYSLTLKGCLFALGFQFNNDEVSSFLRNAGRSHPVFAYLSKISENTSIDMVKEWFLAPIYDLIKRGLLVLDEFASWSIIFEHVQGNIGRKIRSSANSISTDSDYEKFMEYTEHIEQKILRHTFYTDKVTSDWIDFIIEYFYPMEDAQEFLEFWDGKLVESILIYRMMRATHFGYFHGLAIGATAQTQKIPYSKKWKEFNRHNPEFKSPSDFDRKRHQIIDYLAGYSVS